jgi:amino acid adenylation domain-containing protein
MRIMDKIRDASEAEFPADCVERSKKASEMRRYPRVAGEDACSSLEKQLRYWRIQLQGVAPRLELPTEQPRPIVESYREAQVAIVLNASSSSRLKELGRQHGMTPFMVLHAAWAVLLARLSGQEDIVIGTPVVGQHGPQLEGSTGFFGNLLPLRVAVQDDLALADFFRQVRQIILGAHEHQDVPFERIVEALQPERVLNRDSLFRVRFELRSAPRSELRLPGLTARFEESGHSQPAPFDLLLSLEEQGEQIVGSLNYAAELFGRQTVQRWLGCFMVLLQGMTVAEPQRRIGDLPLLPQPERQQVLESFNQTKIAYPCEKLIHRLFEEQVERTPDATAVVYAGHSLSYAELNSRANQLARHLRTMGVGPDQLVGICVERSLEMVIGLLGILKAGGGYLPLDPAYPLERLAYMLADAAPRVLLTQERLRQQLPQTDAEVVALDSDWTTVALQEADNLDAGAWETHSRHLAYVIYTSGSTGQPKGVMVEHAGVVNLLTSMGRNPGIAAADCLLAITTVSFDIAALEIYLPLVKGAKVVLASREAAFDAQLLMHMLEEFEVTVLQATPATWKLLLGAEWSGRSSLRALCGGEALTTDLSGKLLSRVGMLWNLYGPTETTIWSCCQEITPTSGKLATVESIGRPIANTRIYILDSRQRVVPIGVVGEIYIGGAGVARGYLNRPELTSERFIEDPFSGEPQARLYKTGDLGSWRFDGTIEYLGRNDQQVKIRGFRIELGEIEAQLMRHESIEEAVVIARESGRAETDVPGEKCLVAYVVARQGEGSRARPSAEALRAYLKAKMPEYMVPSAFGYLEQLPLTANGKLDRRALPAPAMAMDARLEYEPPRGELEQMLAGVWQKVLQVERIGREDNFFHCGGDSLLATQALTRIRSWLSIDIPIKVLFDFPVLKELAPVLNQLVQTYLLNSVATEGSQLEELLSNMASLSEETVQQLLGELEKGGLP